MKELKNDFLSQYEKEQLKDLHLPKALQESYQLISCISKQDEYWVLLLREKENGKKYLLKTGAWDIRRRLLGEKALLDKLNKAFPDYAIKRYQYGEEDKQCYFLREYLQGITLEEYREREMEISMETFLELALKICDELCLLHQMKPPIIHRDVKPQNIILDALGQVHIIDFEIAREYHKNKRQDTHFAGTDITAAPEQYGYGQTDERTDIFALGRVFCYMLTGEYDVKRLAALEYPDRLVKIIRKCAAFDPSNRYSTVKEVKKELFKLTGIGSKREKKRRGRMLLAGSVGLCLLFSVLFFQVCQQKKKNVSFDSKVLEQAVQDGWYQNTKKQVTYEDLKEVQRIEVVGTRVLKSNENFDYSGEIVIDNVGDISDLSQISHMENLDVLNLSNQNISDISLLKGLPIRTLILCDNHIRDFSVLETMPNLEKLYIAGNPIEVFPDFTKLSRLSYLNIDNLTVDNLEFLRNVKIRKLSMMNIDVKSRNYEPLKDLENLTEIWLLDPDEEILPVLGSMKQLYFLTAHNVYFRDFSSWKGFESLESITITGNFLQSLDGIGNLKKLKGLAIDYTSIQDLKPLEELEKLEYLKIAGLDIKDYSPLLKLKKLNTISVSEEQKEPIKKLNPDFAAILLEE